MKAVARLLVLPLLLGACSDRTDGPATPPAAAMAGPADTDPYAWLEEIEGDRALEWVHEQNRRSLGTLESDPRFDTLYGEALGILGSKARLPLGDIHGEHVYNFWQDDTHVRGLWRRATLDSYAQGAPEWEVLLDIDALDALEQQNWVYKSYQCLAPDFERCLVRLSRGGTDASVVREYSIPERAFVDAGFVLPEAKSSVAWIDHDTLLVATDWGDGLTDSGYPRAVKRWRRGTPLSSAELIYSGEREDVGTWAYVERTDARNYVFAVRAVTYYEAEYRLLGDDGTLSTLPLPGRMDVHGLLDGRLLVSLREPWPYGGRTFSQGVLIALDLADLSAELVYAPGDGEAINDVEVGERSVLVELLDNVIGRVRRVIRTPRGWRSRSIVLPDNGVVKIVSVNDQGDDLLMSFESLTVPNTLLYVEAGDAVSEIMTLPAMYDTTGVVVEQRFATSRDGTRVPYFIMGREAVLERGDAPTVQYAYGGFLSAVLPVYYQDPARPQHGALAGKLWVSRGGVLVLSNIRGGSEFGPAWHEAALKANRQRAFDDFFAISEALIETGVTTPEKLGAIGRSNGGLLMGVAMIQRPDLYAAIDCGVPLLDMLRYHKLLAGASWMAEYGNPDLDEERAYIAAYSPYQNLRQDGDYPDVFFYTSTKDDRVHPGHARKMAAKMAAYGHPFLYYENTEGGHGGTANQKQLARRTALEWLFFLRELM